MSTKQKEALFSAVIAITLQCQNGCRVGNAGIFSVDSIFAQVLELRISLKALGFKHVAIVDYPGRVFFKLLLDELLEETTCKIGVCI